MEESRRQSVMPSATAGPCRLRHEWTKVPSRGLVTERAFIAAKSSATAGPVASDKAERRASGAVQIPHHRWRAFLSFCFSFCLLLCHSKYCGASVSLR